MSVVALPKPATGGDSSEKYVDAPGASAGEKLTTPLPVGKGPRLVMPVNHDVGPS